MAERVPPRARNLSYAAAAGLTGCATLLLVAVALMIGLWLDTRFGVRGPFTIILLLASVPVSLLVMVRVAVRLVSRIVPSVRTAPRPTASESKEG